MKITVICKKDEWQIEQLKKVAPKFNVDIDIRDITTPGDVPENLGDVVMWRSSSLGIGTNRFDMMNKILKKHFLINRCLALIPQATEKAFQQSYIQKKTNLVKGVPTFTFQSISEIELALQNGVLRYPFIQKPNKGSKGKGVELVRNKEDLIRVAKNIHLQVYQNFIKNSGDYRVFILGGRLLGAIKRTARDGSHLNNISQGGSAIAITDPKILSSLRQIGTTVASIFELTICGVDIIHDEETGEYIFLEVNTVPQWRGFQEATGIDIAEEIVKYCKRIANRKIKALQELVREEYDTQIHLLAGKKFHFLSRAFLWTKESSYEKMLADLQENYIGKNEIEYETKLRKTYTTIPEHGNRMVAKQDRMKCFAKYPALEPYLNLLFKNLFAQKIYQIDLRTTIKKIVSDDKLLELKELLENDTEAMRILSTHALNYLYLLDFYLDEKAGRTHPEKYLGIGNSYTDNFLKLQLYFFTHCIIGASRFYSEKIKSTDLLIYREMLKRSEQIITAYFQEISLDNKFEFLVCTRLCEFSSSIEDKILIEAGLSLSPDGNFLIDTQNETASPNERNDFVGAEHRNVLFIMSQTPFCLSATTNSPASA